MKYILALLFISLSLTAQTGYKTASLDNYGKAFWDIARPDINTSGYKYYIRYESHNQIVNLYSNNSLNFEGHVVTYLKEQKKTKKSSFPYRYVYDITNLPDAQCTIIGTKILSEKFYNLPTDDSITGYKKGYFDCWGIEYSFKVKNFKIKKHYTCPWSQTDSINEIKILKANYKLIAGSLQLKKIDDDFQSKLEKGKSYSDGFSYIYKLSESELAAWNKYKPQSDYLRSKKDTIDTLLKDYLSENYDREFTDCFDDFQLEFSKKGKLKKISVTKPFWERMLDKDYHRCRRKVKKLFRKFNLKYLNLEYGFSRDLDFNAKGEASIFDRTLYHSD